MTIANVDPPLSLTRIAVNPVPQDLHTANQANARSLLLRHACVISMDDSVGDFADGDVLIEGDRIAGIGPSGTLSASTATTVIDAEGTIAMPGFVDTHRHMWQGQLRRMVPNVDIGVYLGLRNAFAVRYRPEDQHAGTLANAIGALNAGITTVLDLSHNTRSEEHADAGVEALLGAGIRAVFAYAPPEAGDWDNQWPADLERVQARVKQFDLVTLRMAQRCFSDVDNLTPERIGIARALGLGLTVDPVAWAEGTERILALERNDLLGPDLGFVHCSDLSADAWKAMGAAGVKVSLSPFVDELLGFDTHPELLPTVQRALDVDIRPGLSVDIETTVPGDMFTQMRSVLATQRMRAALGNPSVGRSQLTAKDVLSFATIHGAETIGLGDEVGSLTPGKRADIVIISQTSPEGYPLNNAYGSVVMGADPSSVIGVIVAGRFKKWGNALVETDVAAARDRLSASREYLLAELDYVVDPFIDYPTLELGPLKDRP